MLCLVVILELRCSLEPLAANLTPIFSFLIQALQPFFWAVEVSPFLTLSSWDNPEKIEEDGLTSGSSRSSSWTSKSGSLSGSSTPPSSMIGGLVAFLFCLPDLLPDI